MKILKIILFGILTMIGLVLIIALFVKKQYTIKREITISKPNGEVFDYIKLLKNQDNYNQWVMMDPTMKKEFTGTDGTVGFVYAWDGNEQAGKGEQEIVKINEGNALDLEIRFIKPFAGIAHTQLSTKPESEGKTLVTWTMVGESKYPMNITNLFIHSMLGKDLKISLLNLKNILEK